MRFAFRLAQSHPRKRLTVVTKSKAQRHVRVFQGEIAAETVLAFPEVVWAKLLCDVGKSAVAAPLMRATEAVTADPTCCPPDPAGLTTKGTIAARICAQISRSGPTA